MAYLSLKYWEKCVKTCRQYGTFNDEPQIFFFLKVVIDAIKISMKVYLLHFFCMSIAPRNHPPTLGIITSQPSGLTPNPEDLRPFRP